MTEQVNAQEMLDTNAQDLADGHQPWMDRLFLDGYAVIRDQDNLMKMNINGVIRDQDNVMKMSFNGSVWGSIRRHMTTHGRTMLHDICRRYAVWNDMFDAVPGLRFIEARLEDLKVINTFRWYVTPGVLLSLPGAEEQQPHTDVSTEAIMENTARLDNSPGLWLEQWPLSVVVALQDDTPFVMWGGRAGMISTTRRPRWDLVLNGGDILIFTACCVHAGAALPMSAESNHHLHFHVDTGGLTYGDVALVELDPKQRPLRVMTRRSARTSLV